MSEPQKLWWQRTLPWVASLVAILVVGGHIAMWLSDMPRDLALRLTLLNAAGWAAVILPAFAVSRWLKAKTRPVDPG